MNASDECDLREEKDFQKGIMNAIMVDVASVASAASASLDADANCSTQQDTSSEHEQQGVPGCKGNLDLTNKCDSSQKGKQPHSSRTVGRKRKWAEGGWNRRAAKRKKKKVKFSSTLCFATSSLSV